MNKSALKSYAPQARRDFIEMVTSRANQLGILEHKGQLHVEACAVQGDVALIAGQAFPAKVAQQRQRLVASIQQDGFNHTLEAIAYTWFNRFAALRYMEIHDYLGHGQRVLSSVSPGSLPDILTHALDLAQSGDLPGITPELVSELKLASKDGELYKRLLVAQCNALSASMPFLFERIDDETELLLPDNLLRTDSVIRKLIDSTDEADWQQVEIIGWLYQFYISEKKDQVIGKVVQSEDIPAATQLFTPNWIVKYLVQNSIGRLWLQANPNSPLASQMDYYIQPAEQTPEVQAELDKLIKARIAEDGDTLNPESITVLDPACGSGHILVEVYELLKAIYQERGYRLRDIPRLILEKNLFGLDIDDRAAQLASFALLMKARADDRRLFDSPPRLNVFAVQHSHEVDDHTLAETVLNAAVQAEGRDAFGSGELFDGGQLATEHSSGLIVNDLRELIRLFRHGKTFGSLLSVPPQLAGKLLKLALLIEQVRLSGNTLAQAYANEIRERYLRPAQLLAGHYDAVIANPPYMGARYYDSLLKKLVETHYKPAKGDLYTCFMVRSTLFAKSGAYIGMITIPNWMFLSTFEDLRDWLFNETSIETFSHNGRGVFGSDFGSCAFTFRHQSLPDYKGRYKRLFEKQGSVASNEELNERFGAAKPFVASTGDFRKIPGNPVAYWISDRIRNIFSNNRSMGEMVDAKQSLATADNDRFLRMWQEVSVSQIGFGFRNRENAKASQKKWFPHQKGGDFRKWYGNHEWLVNWENDGEEIRNFKDNDGKVKSRPQGTDYYFKECVSWSDVTSASNAFRYDGHGFIPNVIAPAIFKKEVDLRLFLLAGNNVFYNFVSKVLNPTIHFHVGYFTTLPFPDKLLNSDLSLADELVEIAKADWDASEISWGFQRFPWMAGQQTNKQLAVAWQAWADNQQTSISRMKALEEENNRLFIEAYGLQDELSPEVPEEQITLTRADREQDMQRLVSYALGCMMGRYCLDEPGLIYAHAGNIGFDPSRYATFPADADGIVPMSDMPWFPDDATARVREFLLAVWGADTLAENQAWLAESLGAKADETPEETLRRYISGSFFKDHCSTYKKRPIYWLFSSGKQKAFEALVYLHRYHEGTLARMRAEYVVPLTGKMSERIKLLEDDASKAPTTAARKKIDKELDKLKKKLEELRTYDEKLRHYADQRITLNLDEGVKVNYGKFGDLLEGVKVITGGSGDE